MRLSELRSRRKRLSSLLFWQGLIAPSVVQLTDGFLMSTLHIQGSDMDGALDVELVAQAAKLNNALKRIGGGWAVLSEVRRRVGTRYPVSQWPDQASQLLDDERAAQFTAGQTHYVNDIFLTLVYYTIGTQSSETRWPWLYENLPTVADPTTELVAVFTKECAQVAGLFQGATRRVTVLENEALLGYLHSTISTKLHRVRVPNPPIQLNKYLVDQDVNPGLWPTLVTSEGEVYVRCVCPRGSPSTPAYPSTLYPGILDLMTQLPFELRATLRYVPLRRAEAMGTMRLKARRWRAQQGVAAQEIAQEIEHAQALVQQGKASEGALTATIVLWDTDRGTLQRKVTLVEQTLNNEGFLAKVETLNTMAAWMGSLPGNLWANPRKVLVNSENLAMLFPATAVATGQAWNTHLNGPPAMMVTGKGHTAVGLSLHQGQVAHTGVIGATGYGKSTFLNALCLQHRRYPGQEVVIFDKQYAAQHLTAAVGGAWYDLGIMPLQPLAHLDQPYEQAWALDWLDNLYEQERLPLIPGLKEELAEGLAKVAEYDAVKRTLTTLSEVLDTPALKAVLRRFPQLDGNTDTMADNPWLCFEMATLLETPRVLNVVMRALFHRLEQRLTGVPTMYVLHEGWIALNTPYWRTRLVAWLKGLRARNGWVVLATQSLADAVTSDIMPALLDNIVTWICTPNSRAMTQEIGKYYTAIGFNERQRELLTLGMPQRDYYVAQATGSGMVQLDLGPLGMALCSTPMAEELPHIAALIAAHGAGFLEAYLKEKGVL